MKAILYTVLVFFSFSLFLLACQDGGEDSTTTSEPPVATLNTPSTGSNPQENTTHHTASPDAPLVGLWEYGVSIHPSNPKFKKENEGRWIQLNADNTFISGVYQEQNNSGTWAYKPNAEIIQLNFQDNSINADIDWQVQMSSSQDQMIWKGNADYNTSGAQIKVVRIEQRPAGS